MFETLSKGFRAAKQRLTGKAELDDAIIDKALRDVRLSLLEGDVEFRVVKRFMERVREAARGEQVKLKAKSEEYGVQRITPEQAFIKICQDELTKMMGPVDTEFNKVAGVRFALNGLDAKRVAREAVDGMFAGKTVIVPGLAMKAMTVARHFAPDSLLARITYHFQHKKGVK